VRKIFFRTFLSVRKVLTKETVAVQKSGERVFAYGTLLNSSAGWRAQTRQKDGGRAVISSYPQNTLNLFVEFSNATKSKQQQKNRR